jgi:hypothetical protein
MRVTVAYWEGGQVVTRSGAEWASLPVDGVLWVDVERDGYLHRMRGADGYWVHGTRYGCTFEWAQPRFGGSACAAWEWSGGSYAVSLGETPPPEGVQVLRGKMLPDDVWARVLG